MRQRFVSAGILLFFAACLTQPLMGNREDWPFSYFGMYKGRLSPKDVYRIDIDVTLPTGQVVSAYELGVNTYYVRDEISKILTGYQHAHNNDVLTPASDLRMSDEALQKVREMLRSDLLPKLRRLRISETARVSVTYRKWNQFTYERRHQPDIQTLVFDDAVGGL